MATELDWNDPRIDEQPGGLVLVDGAPFTGVLVDSTGGLVRSRADYLDGLPDGRSQDYVDGLCRREEWYRRGGLEGPSFEFDAAGAMVRVDFYSRGVRLVTHEFVDDEWLESFRIEPTGTHADLARMRWSD